MTPLVVKKFTVTSCIGRGLAENQQACRVVRSGLAPCAFETVDIDTCIGEVRGLETECLPGSFSKYDCRNNRLALLALKQDQFMDLVADRSRKWGRGRIGIFLGTST